MNRRTVAKHNSQSAIPLAHALPRQPAAPAPQEIRAQLEKVLASRLFARSTRLCRFLRFSVEESLAGNPDVEARRIVPPANAWQAFDIKASQVLCFDV